VTLQSNSPNLILEVRDNGSGMAGEAQASEGFGLANMRARVKKLNGSLEIQTACGSGTRIIVSVPINESVRKSGGQATLAKNAHRSKTVKV